MTVWISSIHVEGVRGFNEQRNIDIGPGLNIFVGKNGSGKTSLLQAIEWCLTGKMDYMKGEEFSQEDAIVNLFNPSHLASVSLVLNGLSSKVIVSRRRKMSKSTNRGASPLTVKIGSKNFEDEEAEGQLERILGLPFNEISSSIYLHQDSLKNILSADAKDRSRTIDKMIGMEELRSLIESLASTRKITTAVKDLQSTIERLRRDKVEFAQRTKLKVDQCKERLIETGYSESELGSSSKLTSVWK